MGLGVGCVLELSELVHPLLRLESVGDCAGVLHLPLDEFQVCAVRFHDVAPLLGLGGGHDDRDVVALRGGHEREADAGVAARRFDEVVAGFDLAGLFGGFDHRQRRSVFRRAAGVLRLDLRGDRRAGRGLHLHQRRADGLEDAPVHYRRLRRPGTSAPRSRQCVPSPVTPAWGRLTAPHTD